MDARAFFLTACAAAAIQAAAVSDDRNYVAEVTPDVGLTKEPGLASSGRVAVRYADGIGRTVAEILVGEGGASGSPGLAGYVQANDIATVTEYDAAGRAFRQWVPFPTGGGKGDFPAGHAALAGAYHGQGSRPFTETVFDSYRKDDPAEVAGPGKGRDAHPAKRRRLGTDPADARLRCRAFKADLDGPTLTITGYYPVGSLRVAADTDPDGAETLTFTDRLGRRVLVRREAPGGGWADTYFVYDARGDLRHVLSPEMSLRLGSRRVVKAADLEALAFYYEYDRAHRMILRRAPGAGPAYYVYDRLGNPVLSQDAAQRQRGEWTVMKYDRKLRPAVAGTAVITAAPKAAGAREAGGVSALSINGGAIGGVIGGGGVVTPPIEGVESATPLRLALTEAYADSLLIEEPDYRQIERTLQYTCRSGPEGFVPFRAWHYDSYRVWDETWPPDRAETPLSGGVFPPTGLPTVEMFLTSPTERPHLRGYAYDHAGRLTATAARDSYSDIYSHSERLTLDFNGRVTAADVTARLMTEKTVLERHTARWEHAYDRAGRLKSSSLSIDGGPAVVAEANLYDPAGRLRARGSGGLRAGDPYGAVVSTVAHDTGGELTAVSSPLFAQRVWLGEPPSWGGAPRWSGSPCADSTFTATPGGGAVTRRLAYSFDPLDRLTAATDAAGGGAFAESRSFDLNGNILSLERDIGGVALQRIDAAYDGNRLSALNDVSGGELAGAVPSIPPGYRGEGAFAYDTLGRLTADASRSVVAVGYDPLSGRQASLETADGRSVVSAYLPDGTLLSRETRTPRVTVTTTVNADGDTIVRTRRGSIVEREERYGPFSRRRDAAGAWSWRFHHPGGMAVIARDGSVEHYFYLRDRLGSTRVVFGMDGQPVQSVGYFPDGLPVALGTSAAVTDRLHEGMPFVDHAGIAAYDNDARWLQAALPRFDTPDPKADAYPHISPYANRACNPTRYLDPSGEDILNINIRGELVERIENIDGDKVVIEKGDHPAETDEGGNETDSEISISFKYGTVENVGSGIHTFDGKNYPYIWLQVRGDENGKKLFEFLSDNLSVKPENVEFGLVQTGIEGDKGLNYVTSGSVAGSEPGVPGLFVDRLQNGYNIRSMIHSHPSGKDASKGDKAMKRTVVGAQLAKKVRIPTFQIYHVQSKKYSKF